MSAVSEYYQVGGTVHRGAQSYIVRQADEELFGGLSQGEFCYVLDSRQIGKSSLMLRTAGRLREEGALAIILDLTALGQNLTAEQWYAGLLGKVAKELWQMDIDLEDELDEFWLAHPQMGPFQRWMSALREVVLAKTLQPVVIFVDEIDAVRSLPFSTDEFFAGIREGYNRRTRDSEFKRLTFCLLGVATPSDLMQEARMTPFNIGKRIELKDFTPEEAAPLASGLGRDDRLAKKLLDRILYWTGGHPYLTQVLCRAVAEDPAIHNSAGVDRQCEKLFLSPRAREKDDNLLFVSKRVLSGDIDRAGLLHLYETIRVRKRTRDDETNPLVAHLRLAGLTRVLEGYLWVRNRIYFRVFDREWVNANMPDAELRRQKAAFQRGLVRASLVAAVIIVSLLGGIVWYWDAYLRENVTHYKNFVKRYGIPQGVGKLSTTQASHRAVSFRFVTKGRYGPLLGVRAVDGSGALTPQHGVGTYLRYADKDTSSERECQWEFILDPANRVVYEIARDRFNRLVWAFVYSPMADVSPEAKSSKRGNQAKAHFVGPDGYPQPQPQSGVDYVNITYDEDGNEKKVVYTDRRGNRMPGLDKAYGVAKKYNRLGLPSEIVSLDQNDLPMVDSAGNASLRRQYDEESGNLLGTKFFDADGNITRLNDGYAETKMWDYDGNGNAGTVAYFGPDGKPTFHKSGYHKFTARYDERGNRIEVRYFATDDQPILSKAGYHLWKIGYDLRGNQVESAYFDTKERRVIVRESGLHRISRVRDDLGRIVEESYFDTKGNPMLHKNGYHKFTARYDERGNRIEERYFGRDDQPILSKGGYHSWRASYNARGNRIEDRYFGLDDQPRLSSAGFHLLRTSYDAHGNELERTCFDTKELPVVDRDSGLHRLSWVRDDLGRIVEEAYFGADGIPALNKKGYHKIAVVYDKRGNSIEQRYFGPDKQPILSKAGYHLWRAIYDARGNQIEWAYFDTEERPLIHPNPGAHRIKVRDDLGRIVEESYFDTKGNPMLHKNGYHKFTALYDERGNRVEERYFDLDNHRILSKTGYHKFTARFDARDNQIELAYFDTKDGAAVDLGDGTHLTKKTYDELGRIVEQAYFDPDGKPMLQKSGYHKFTALYDERGNRIDERYFDLDNQPILLKAGYHKITARYDAGGNRVELAYFDANGPNGKPTLHKDGYHKLTTRYDERGNRIEERYFGPDNQPILSKAGYHKFTARYDARGNQIEWAYFDTEQRPILDPDPGRHRVSKVFDKLGRIVQEAYFGSDGNPTLHKDGYHKFAARYDERGNRIEVRYFGPDNQRILSKAGYHLWKIGYDARGNRIEAAVFDTNEQPVVDLNSGVHRMRTVYDDKSSKVVEEAYFDTKGKPTLHKDGYHKFTARYDERGNRIEERYLGPDNQPMLSKAGYHLWRASYDARGNQIELAYFDTKDVAAVDLRDGTHLTKKTYDERGRIVEQAYFDPNGKPGLYQEGYQRITARYDEDGKMIERRFFDVDNSPVRSISLIQISEVFPNSEARRIGLQPGDFVWSYGDWVFRTGDESPDYGLASEAFIAATRRPGNGLRRLLVIRGPSLIEFQVNPGRLGIAFSEFAMPDTWLRKVLSANPEFLPEPAPAQVRQ